MRLFEAHSPKQEHSQEWATPPPAIFLELDSEFHFTVDVCADAANAKCSRYYDIESDGLSKDWAGEVAWMNPPYTRRIIDRWVEKAAKAKATVVCLLPASTSSGWWHDYVLAYEAEIRYIRGRVRFGAGRGTPTTSSVIVIFRGQSA